MANSPTPRCPWCGAPLVERNGPYGRFIGCSGWPDCDYSQTPPRPPRPPGEPVGRNCPMCAEPLVWVEGRHGRFVGCSNFPRCRYSESPAKPGDSGLPCPACGRGNLLARRTAKGALFHACSRFPACDYQVWGLPLPEQPCPKCNWPFLTLQRTRSGGCELRCPEADCNHHEALDTAKCDLLDQTESG